MTACGIGCCNNEATKTYRMFELCDDCYKMMTFGMSSEYQGMNIKEMVKKG